MTQLTEGRVCKGGQNIPTESELANRPPAPKGSAGPPPFVLTGHERFIQGIKDAQAALKRFAESIQDTN